MEKFVASLFPSDPSAGRIGCIEYNIWMAHIVGVPLPGLRKYSMLVKGILYLYGTLITVLCSFLYTGFEFYDLYLCWPDFDSFTQNFCLTLSHFAGSLKIINIFYHLPELKISIEKVKLATRTYVLSDAQKRVLFKGDLQNKVFLTLYATIVGFTGSSAMFLLFFTPSMAGQMFPYRVTLPGWLPFAVQVIYIGVTDFIFAMQIVTIDFLNVAMMNLIRYHLNILNLTFDELMADCQIQPKVHPVTQAERNNLLKSIIRHHCILIELREEVERIFRVPVLIQFCTSLMISAITGFRATVQSTNMNSALIIYFYCFCIFCQIFFYCWFGNEAFEQSRTLATSGYSSLWYNFDPSFKKNLLIFLVNAQRPFVFTAGGFMALSLPSFTSILSNAYSFIAVLRQMYDR